jgi:hypothetical protein
MYNELLINYNVSSLINWMYNELLINYLNANWMYNAKFNWMLIK